MRPVSTPVPSGPLAVRWHGVDPGDVRAGVIGLATVELENAGSGTWRSRGSEGDQLSSHWLDELGNPIVWDGVRSGLREPIEPGRRLRHPFSLRGPLPPGRYVLAVDLVEEGRYWFAEVGNRPLEQAHDVRPRMRRRLAAKGGDARALAEQEEPLVDESEAEAVVHLAPGVAPARDWSRRILDAHQEGYALVGGAVDARGLLGRRPRELEPWAPGAGRLPRFGHPLLCPSVARDVEPRWVEPVRGLPAARPPDGEPWLHDGRIVVRLAGRR
jgi:hypothetical protein